ncbi:MAG: DUF1800 family protein [Planctomycetota bacterium]
MIATASLALSLLTSDEVVVRDARSPQRAWDARMVEHLLNRAAFGATREEIEAGVRMGCGALIDELFRPRPEVEWPVPVLLRWEDFGLTHLQLPLEGSSFMQMQPGERMALCKESKSSDREAFTATFEQWFHSMVDGRDPLRDRMTLFWHGFFTTSWAVNKRKYELVEQFQWLRGQATGSYADLLRGIGADPAMLQYLDNTSNSRGHPNENLARELMELYSLGEGHYTEVDVREAARALTGAVCTSEGSYAFLADAHDSGSKFILGERGNHGPAELVEILLHQEACARWVAGRLIAYFEGLAPGEQRLASYAEFLRRGNYEVEPFLRRLFSDPDFYRDEAVATRISAPIEHLAGICHKLEVHPSNEYLQRATNLLGQAFYFPPSVKGWSDGILWMSNDAMMRRSNCAGLIAGVYGSAELSLRAQAWIDRERDGMHDDAEAAALEWQPIEAEIKALDDSKRAVFDLQRQLDPHSAWRPWDPCGELLPRLREQGLAQPSAWMECVLEDWLAIPVPRETLAMATRFLHERCARAGIDENTLLEDPAGFAQVMPGIAHLVFSLPEAQLR